MATQTTEQYLFVFRFDSPGNEESYNAVWIQADTKNVAFSLGRQYAKRYVENLFMNTTVPICSWSHERYDHWISSNPLEEFSGLALETFPTIVVDSQGLQN